MGVRKRSSVTCGYIRGETDVIEDADMALVRKGALVSFWKYGKIRLRTGHFGASLKSHRWELAKCNSCKINHEIKLTNGFRNKTQSFPMISIGKKATRKIFYFYFVSTSFPKTIKISLHVREMKTLSRKYFETPSTNSFQNPMKSLDLETFPLLFSSIITKISQIVKESYISI